MHLVKINIYNINLTNIKQNDLNAIIRKLGHLYKIVHPRASVNDVSCNERLFALKFFNKARSLSITSNLSPTITRKYKLACKIRPMRKINCHNVKTAFVNSLFQQNKGQV